ncbi:photosystem II S4 domain protein [Synechococcus sp. SynAce01]|uniref:photosystem II S4 domain protein n=1 Tax=Synechococcus sp. SynAce01 TaxID=1916956 RepID=UPI0008FF238A|nr:photosystem II S4 domain protein [Synechococcus sp. SynAce01]APD48531.1 photosystem II S4 domain protein [Synechococcus sp. SynAce01]
MPPPSPPFLLPREALLASSANPAGLAPLLPLAEQALRNWVPVWSNFLTAAILEDALEQLGGLSELTLQASGGHSQAERCCLRFERSDTANSEAAPEWAALEQAPLLGLEMQGNFLFDPATPADFRQGLLAAGAAPGELGDLWVRGDRGAQLITTQPLAARLGGQQIQVRTVAVELEVVPLSGLKPPVRPQPRVLSTVEASLRLDAVASAGFGVSRSRMADWIRQGVVRINWRVVRSPSRELVEGDRVQLDDRGELTVLKVEATKRERWRLNLNRT